MFVIVRFLVRDPSATWGGRDKEELNWRRWSLLTATCANCRDLALFWPVEKSSAATVGAGRYPCFSAEDLGEVAGAGIADRHRDLNDAGIGLL